MRVKELKLHNFRGIKDLHLVFNPQYNVVVLVGVNGVGKSSILDCINLLMKFYVINCPTSCYNISMDDRDINTYNENILSLADICIGTDETINEIVFEAWEGADLKWKIAKFRQKDLYEEDWKEINKESKDNIKNHSQNSEHIYHHYFYYLANREVVNLPMHGIDKTAEIINFKDFSQWFKDREDLENEWRLTDDVEYRHPVLETVRSAVYSLLGEGYENLTFKRAININKMTIKKFGQEIAVELLSDGEKSLLAMVGDLSRRLASDSNDPKYPFKVNNPLEAPALVLIDEIELHLHPAWQRMIIPRLTRTFPNCQFIVTTHSPQVLSHVDPECIHILDYEGDKVVVKRPENSYGLDSNRILEDILGVSKRPQEIQDRMLELFRFINNNDLESAKKIVRELGAEIGINEPELVKAEATIKRREIIGR